ncbi:MAG: hypothetical protein Q4F02_01410 [Candidatus Saccharibacteria bacterium]|nr:hypothetical protein [Candidatus Saccharibacteria bacterium]
MRGTNRARSTLIAYRPKAGLGGASAAPWRFHAAADCTPVSELPCAS